MSLCRQGPKVVGAGAKQSFQWNVHSAKLRDTMQISPDFAPWTSRPEVKLRNFPVVSAATRSRMLDLMNIAWAARLREGKGKLDVKALKQGFYVNLSQACQRKPWGSIGTMLQGNQERKHIAPKHTRFKRTSGIPDKSHIPATSRPGSARLDASMSLREYRSRSLLLRRWDEGRVGGRGQKGGLETYGHLSSRLLASWSSCLHHCRQHGLFVQHGHRVQRRPPRGSPGTPSHWLVAALHRPRAQGIERRGLCLPVHRDVPRVVFLQPACTVVV